MTHRISLHISADTGYTPEEKRIAHLWRRRRKMFPGDAGLLATERHPAIMDQRTPLTVSIGELVG